MDNQTKKFDRELVVKSSTDNLSVIRAFIREMAEEIGFSRDNTDKIILAVDEACTNIIKHAYNYSPEGEILIKTHLKNSKFEIAITDKGKKFDPADVPDPDIKEYYRQRRVGGLGMFLMKKLMDEVYYKNLRNNRNQVKLVKYL